MRAVVLAASLVLVLANGAAAETVLPQPDIFALTWSSSQTERVNLTNSPTFDGWPSPSPDDRRIAFASTRSGFDAIWTMNSDGSDPRRLTDRLEPDVHDLGPVTWSPDGRWLAFTATLEPPGRDVRYWHYLVYVVPSTGGTARRLDLDGWTAPSFSSDSKLIAYSVPSTVGAAIAVANADGSQARELARGSSAPVFAPRGRRILYLRDQRHVATMDATGRVRWTLRGYSALDATWTRDGRVAFVATGVRRPGLYLVRPGSQRPRKIVDIADGFSLVLTADSRYAAVSAIGGTYIVRLAGGYFRRAGDEAGAMAWSPDGRQLAFVTEYGTHTLAVASVPGDTVEFGFPQAAEYFGLAWNGGRVLFGST